MIPWVLWWATQGVPWVYSNIMVKSFKRKHAQSVYNNQIIVQHLMNNSLNYYWLFSKSKPCCARRARRPSIIKISQSLIHSVPFSQLIGIQLKSNLTACRRWANRCSVTMHSQSLQSSLDIVNRNILFGSRTEKKKKCICIVNVYINCVIVTEELFPSRCAISHRLDSTSRSSVGNSVSGSICLVKAERRGLRQLSTDANVGKLASHVLMFIERDWSRVETINRLKSINRLI